MTTNVTKAPIQNVAAHAPISPRFFYDLDRDPKYIKANVDSYWRHLTLDSHEIYEKIYRESRSPNGYVHCMSLRSYMPVLKHPNLTIHLLLVRSFTQQFNRPNPPPAQIAHVWSRLLRDQSTPINKTSHPKGFVMAVCYMLHIETYLHEKPRAEHDIPGAISKPRRELLKRYGNWVSCHCDTQCRKEWNFANDVGMWRGANAKWKCKLVAALESKGIRKFLVGEKEEKMLTEVRKSWELSRRT